MIHINHFIRYDTIHWLKSFLCKTNSGKLLIFVLIKINTIYNVCLVAVKQLFFPMIIFSPETLLYILKFKKTETWWANGVSKFLFSSDSPQTLEIDEPSQRVVPIAVWITVCFWFAHVTLNIQKLAVSEGVCII